MELKGIKPAILKQGQCTDPCTLQTPPYTQEAAGPDDGITCKSRLPIIRLTSLALSPLDVMIPECRQVLILLSLLTSRLGTQADLEVNELYLSCPGDPNHGPDCEQSKAALCFQPFF